MNTDNPHDVLLRQVNARLRRTQIVAAGAFLMLLALVLYAIVQRGAGLRQLTMRDEQGRLRARLGVVKGNPTFELLDEQEQPRFSASLHSNGGGAVDLLDNSGARIATMSTEFNNSGQPLFSGVTLRTLDGTIHMSCGFSLTSLELHSGKRRIDLKMLPTVNIVSLSDGNGSPRLQASLGADGDLRTQIMNPNGDVVWSTSRPTEN